ncbi:hypothetical protein CEUSTIGMA_g11623.t1 [Chlamydomonas eustigma]|uniref:TsaA-like domain-containing protein n=1 Tax=Chlamydomonas eustigma TaxID=1157962 RepID=A0A250XN12_9CHLO|nr:hypothetical protein CEUSTIGMA_g11623.t1 [Chlamydomonas eustigma]|eukprot:GAX84200.1 hypothetical protein CEUSTIGMA_g11623.t1 [Chlamydomonas eustigma]
METSGNNRGIIERCAVSIATAWGFYLMAKFVNHRWHVLRLENEVQKFQSLLDHERSERRGERQGRVRAEQELHKLQYKLIADTSAPAPGSILEPHRAAAAGHSSEPADMNRGPLSPSALSYPFRPIGTAHSCFSQRNGTPRQPLLVPAARCRISLAPDIPPSSLSGLEEYSHVWIIYIFHENTDMVKIWQGDRSGVKAKVHVPRLNGGKRGVLATRSPHRPVPIGLSVAQV